MTKFVCQTCNDPIPHDHGRVHGPGGNSAPAIIYRSDRDPRAELRDSETGEVIFRAKKGPLKLVAGGLTTKDPANG